MADRRNRGFTLVEILVALAVLAISLAGAMRLSAQTIDATVALRDHSVALWVAQNKMAENFILPDWPDTVTTDGEADMGGQKYYWRQEISRTALKHIRKIDITVRREPNDGQVLAQLIGNVRDPKPASYP
ncbi:MAG: type II secretion system minor pseudopilin GspI [Sulfuricaulis sp.]|nr:type II secretion system minor pseudopilin GspI [Sulfuricaulis sp.]